MGDAIFRIAINLIIGVGTILIIWLGARHIDALTKEVERYHSSDTTMVVVSDTTMQYYILPE